MGWGLVGRGQGGRGLVNQSQGGLGQGSQFQVRQLQHHRCRQGSTFTNINLFPLVLIYPQTDAEIPEFTKKPHRYRSLPPMCKIKRIGWVSFIYKQMDTSLHICCYTVHLITYFLLYCTPYYISSILLIEV